jgi:Thioesterase superfamily
MPDDAEVLTVELKVNLLAPASGHTLVAEGRVVRAGGTLTVCRGDGYAEQGARGDDAGDDGAPEQAMSAEANQLTNVPFLDGYRVELIERPPS